MKLNKKQDVAAQLMASGLNANQTAQRLDVDRSTVGRWKEDPKFTAQVDMYTSDGITRAKGELESVVIDAIGALRRGMLSEETSDRDVLKAAEIVMSAAKLELSPKVTLSGNARDIQGWLK